MVLQLASRLDVLIAICVAVAVGVIVGIPIGTWIQSITRPWCCDGCAAALAARRRFPAPRRKEASHP